MAELTEIVGQGLRGKGSGARAQGQGLRQGLRGKGSGARARGRARKNDTLEGLIDTACKNRMWIEVRGITY